MERQSDQKISFPKRLGKETIKTTAEVIHERLTRVGGWGVAGGRKITLDAIKKGIQELTK